MTEDVTGAGGQSLQAFYQDAMGALAALAQRYGLHMQPSRAEIRGDALHIILSVSDVQTSEFYAAIWDAHYTLLGLPDYVRPGDRLIDPETSQEWILMGLDPINSDMPVLVKDLSGTAAWMGVEGFGNLQPM